MKPFLKQIGTISFIVRLILITLLASACSSNNKVDKIPQKTEDFFKNLLKKDAAGTLSFPSDFGPEGDIILPKTGACDPHIRIFDGKAWMFASHDEGPGNKFYKMRDWFVCSSPDLVHWKIETIVKPEDTYIGSSIQCWATDAAGRNGKHYMYLSDGTDNTAVVVSENGPAGPYVDVLKKPLLANDLGWNNEYDPTIFIDDDDTPYILWGFGGDFIGGSSSYQIAKLNDDMISLAEKPRDIDDVAPHVWRDANYLHKHKGVYYLNTHQSNYASSKDLYGPYVYRGHCGPPAADHGTFFTWNNQTYYVYGLWYSDYFRYTKMVYCHYKDDGEIISPETIGESKLGVGRYDAEWSKIEAEWYFAASDETDKRENSTGFEVRDITSNSYLYFPKVKNISKNAQMEFQISSANTQGGYIEVYEDTPTGKLLGSVEVKSTGGWDKYKTITCNLKNEASTKNIVLYFRGKTADELLRLDWFSFRKK